MLAESGHEDTPRSSHVLVYASLTDVLDVETVMIVVCRFEDCPAYSDVDKPLKVVEERERSVLYVCRTCLRGRLVTKDHCGGTLGAGAKEDGRRSVVGRGF